MFILINNFYKSISSFLSSRSRVWSLSRCKDLRQKIADCQEAVGVLLDLCEIFVDAFEDLAVGRVFKIVDPETGLCETVIFLKYVQDCSQEFALFLQGEVRNLSWHILI